MDFIYNYILCLIVNNSYDGLSQSGLWWLGGGGGGQYSGIIDTIDHYIMWEKHEKRYAAKKWQWVNKLLLPTLCIDWRENLHIQFSFRFKTVFECNWEAFFSA